MAALPDNVKKQAMSALNHRETVEQIRALTGDAKDVSPEGMFTQSPYPPDPTQPLNAAAKRQVMNSITHSETQSHIRLVRDNGSVEAPITPSRGTQRIAGKIAQMHKSGQCVDSIHQDMTKDHFGKADLERDHD